MSNVLVIGSDGILFLNFTLPLPFLLFLIFCYIYSIFYHRSFFLVIVCLLACFHLRKSLPCNPAYGGIYRKSVSTSCFLRLEVWITIPGLWSHCEKNFFYLATHQRINLYPLFKDCVYFLLSWDWILFLFFPYLENAKSSRDNVHVLQFDYLSIVPKTMHILYTFLF